jgi:hypothetical protein
VAQQLQAFAVASGDQAEVGVVFDQGAGVYQLAIKATGQCCFGQAGADIGGHIGHAQGLGIMTLAAVGQGDAGHMCSLITGNG